MIPKLILARRCCDHRRRLDPPPRLAEPLWWPPLVLTVLEQVGAELCVIGIRRRTAVGKMLMGSNAHRILMDAPCPVLAVKAVDHD